jgi:hypothetical protein
MVGLTLAAPLTTAAVHISNELRGRSDDAGLPVAEPAPLAVPVGPDPTPPVDRRRALLVVGHRYHPDGTMRAVVG